MVNTLHACGFINDFFLMYTCMVIVKNSWVIVSRRFGNDPFISGLIFWLRLTSTFFAQPKINPLMKESYPKRLATITQEHFSHNI